MDSRLRFQIQTVKMSSGAVRIQSFDLIHQNLWNSFLTLYHFLGSDFGVGVSAKEVLIQGFGLASCSAGNEYTACGTAPVGKLQEISRLSSV